MFLVNFEGKFLPVPSKLKAKKKVAKGFERGRRFLPQKLCFFWKKSAKKAPLFLEKKMN